LLVDNKKTKDHVIFLGEAGFPIGLAAMQRMILMSKAFLHVGCRVTVLSRKGVWGKNEKQLFDYKGSFEGIDYYYTTKSVLKPKGFVKRNLQKVKGIYGEFKYLSYLKKNGKINCAILSNRKTVHVLRYLFYAAYFDFPIVINLVEMASALQHGGNLSKKIDGYIFDKWLLKLFNGALPISDNLKKYYESVSPSKPNLKLPVICDFQKFNLERSIEEPYFLYCGSIEYGEVINFVIDAYKKVSNHGDTRLYMIVSGGNKKETELLEQEINGQFDNQPVKLFSDIPYKHLVYLYTNALALLIPLRPTIQDTYRFPHKIGEYLASGNPVVTTNMGEIKNYFEDGKTALLSENYAVDEFADKMTYVLKYPEISRKIGLKGREMGLREFDYKTHGTRLQFFLGTIA